MPSDSSERAESPQNPLVANRTKGFYTNQAVRLSAKTPIWEGVFG